MAQYETRRPYSDEEFHGLGVIGPRRRQVMERAFLAAIRASGVRIKLEQLTLEIPMGSAKEDRVVWHSKVEQ